MPEHLAKLREWWILESRCTGAKRVTKTQLEAWNESQASDDEIHVVEYSALEQAQNKINALTLNCQAKDAEIAELEIGEGRRDAAIEELQSQLVEKDVDIAMLLDDLTAANAKLEKLKDACERRMRSDEACGRHFDEDMGKALAEVGE